MSTNDNVVSGNNHGTPGETLKEPLQVGTPLPPQGFSIDDIMWRVRAEVTRRRNGHVNGLTFPAVPSEIRSFDLSMPRWKPAVPRLQIKSKYRLTELLAFSDADFVDAAYRAILRRPPDEVGFKHYLQVVRGGGSAKILIIRDFLATPEGQSCGVRIEGLSLPLLLEKYRKKKFVGPIVIWAHALFRLGTLADRQATSEASEAREIQELGRLVNEASEHLLQRIVALKVQLAGRVSTTEFEALKNELASTKSHLAELETEVDREFVERPDGSVFAEMKQSCVSAMSRLSNFEAEVRSGFQSHEEQVTDLKGRLDSVISSIQLFMARDEQDSKDTRALNPFYAPSEDHFGGDRPIDRTRIEPYLVLMREVGAGTREAPIVDIGCGRGELLELIRDCGLVGRGIEVNQAFVDTCRGRGLEVTEGDASESLQAMPEGSAGAVISMHVIEHLPFERAIAMLDEARRVLRPGGLLLLETLNPENASLGRRWFPGNPAHVNLLPPAALRWIVEARGFHDVRIEHLVFARDNQGVPTPLTKDVPGATAVNSRIASRGASLDYAIVGTRP